jgi:GT2 family glycosyltransferase
MNHFSNANSKQIGYVVPTLGTRPELLFRSLSSIKSSDNTFVCVVAPKGVNLAIGDEAKLIDLRVVDPGDGLASAISKGIDSLPNETKYISWLGDDDLIDSSHLDACLALFATNKDISMIYGSCDYINIDNERIGINRLQRVSKFFIRFGPCLIPQPGSLINKQKYIESGGLDRRLGWAFDLDLFIKLSKVGRLQPVDLTLGSFRWHNDSLTVASRKDSVREASRVRKSYYYFPLRFVSEIWELPIRTLTLYAGFLVSMRNSKMQSGERYE